MIYWQLQWESGDKKRPSILWMTAFVQFGSPARTRTTDKVVNSHLLYRLSYWGMSCFRRLLTLRCFLLGFDYKHML